MILIAKLTYAFESEFKELLIEIYVNRMGGMEVCVCCFYFTLKIYGEEYKISYNWNLNIASNLKCEPNVF